jgi:hypothetical protein
MWARFITVAVAWFLAAGVVRPAAGRVPTEIDREIHDVTVAELKAHIAVLASDAMAGRGLGHAGNQQAEAYITRALRDGKVPPALPDYLQRVRVYEPRLGDKSSLTITDDGRSLADLRDGHDFMPLPESSDQTATMPCCARRDCRATSGPTSAPSIARPTPPESTAPSGCS